MGIYDRDYYQGDEIRPLRPWDNKSMVTLLIIANVAVFLANFLFTWNNNALTNALALTPNTPWDFHWWQFITYGFAHDRRISHILFNMASLYFLGRSVEDRLGKWEFFRFYMVAIFVCGLVWCFLHQDSKDLHLIGASGATTAVSMLFVFFFPQATLMLYFALPVKAWVVGVIIVVANLFQPMGSQVAYDVHLVGVAVAAAYFFGKWNFGFLGRQTRDWKSKLKIKRSGLRVHDPASGRSGEKARRDEEESDRILDKIYREGESSLTPKERKFLEQYSRRVRQRRGD